MGVSGRRSLMRGANFFLNIYPGASFALSLRKLSATATRSIRVRRSSDNTEQDIGFDGIGLDTSSLLTFCGSGDGLVTIIYDQSGNGNDAVQATSGDQEPIVIAGVVQEDGGKPAIKGLYRSSGYDTGLTGLSEKSVFTIINSAPNIFSSEASRILTSYIGASEVGDELLFDYIQSGTYARCIDGGATVTKICTAARHLFYARKTASGGLALAIDDGSPATGAGSTSANTLTYKVIEEGGLNDSTREEVPLYWQEIIVYPTDQDSNRDSAIANINNYYSLF